MRIVDRPIKLFFCLLVLVVGTAVARLTRALNFFLCDVTCLSSDILSWRLGLIFSRSWLMVAIHVCFGLPAGLLTGFSASCIEIHFLHRKLLV